MDGLYLYKVKTDKPYRDGVYMILSLLAAGAVANVGERARLVPVPSIGFVDEDDNDRSDVFGSPGMDTGGLWVAG